MFCLVWMDIFLKEGSGYLIRDFASHPGTEQNVPTSLVWVNPNTAAAGNRTRRLAQHQAATRTQADWNSVCPRRNPGVRTAPGWTPGIVRTLCRPSQAFWWFPIHKPSSNSIVTLAWITEPAKDSRSSLRFFKDFFQILVLSFHSKGMDTLKFLVVTW